MSLLREELKQKDDKIFELESNLQVLLNKDQDTFSALAARDARIEAMEASLEEQLQYSRRHSIRINGLGPFNSNEDFTKIVLNTAEKMQVPLVSSDIDRAHPAGKDKKQLIVRFTNYAAKRRMYSSRKKLKQVARNVYVNEDLTAKRYVMFQQLLKLKVAKVIENAWTNDGRLFVWHNGQKQLIKSESDINSLK